MVRVQVGEVRVDTDLQLSPRQLHRLLEKATTVALMLQATQVEEEETKPNVSLGFTTEIADPIEPDLSEYFEE